MSNLMMPSRVLLYGRVVQGITIDASIFDTGNGGIPGLGSNRFLREQFDPSAIDGELPCFAMIYGFEYEAHYHDLMAPTIMLVHGDGVDYSRGRRVVVATAAAAAAREATFDSVLAAAYAATDGNDDVVIAAVNAAEEVAIAGPREVAAAIAARDAVELEGASAESVAHAATTIAPDGNVAAAAQAAANMDGATPLSVSAAAAAAAPTPSTVAEAAANASAATPYIGRVEKPFPDFADNVRIWPYDKADFSLRLDPCSGPLESILLEAEIDDAELADEMAGRKVSGRKVGGYLGRGRKVSGRKVGISGRKVRGD